MTTRRAVIVAPNYWNSPLQVGSHAIARAFVSMGWRVAYVSDPISPLHVGRAGSLATRERFRTWLRGGRCDLDGDLFTTVPATLLSPRTSAPALLRPLSRRWVGMTLPSIAGTLRSRGFEGPDVLWVDSVIYEELPEAIEAQRLVLRIADRADGFASHTAELARMERDLIRRADLVVYSARMLEDHVRAMGPRRASYMPNGVDLDRFTADTNEPADLAGIPRPRAIYVGSLEAWFDFDGLQALLERLTGVSFVLIGPDHLARRRLRARPNLHVLGPRDAQQVPAYLQHASVGLIPFDVVGSRALVEAVQPVKLYEYLAAGLPVVARRWSELELLHSPALLYDTVEEGVNAIQHAIADIDAGPRRAWVAESSWQGRLRSVLEQLDLAPHQPARSTAS